MVQYHEESEEASGEPYNHSQTSSHLLMLVMPSRHVMTLTSEMLAIWLIFVMQTEMNFYFCSSEIKNTQWNKFSIDMELFPPASAVEGIESVPSVCVCACACVSVCERSHD